MRDAVLVLAPQAERRADLGAGGVAAALAARDHDDPALDVVALVPDAARPDDARVVVRMGPLAHHVDLHRLARPCTAPPEPPGPPTSTTASGRNDHAETLSRPLILAPLRTTSNRAASVRYSRLSAPVKCARLPSAPCARLVGVLLVAALVAARERPRRAAAERRPGARVRALRRGAPARRDARSTARAARRPGGRARGPALPVRGLLPRDRAHDDRRRGRVHASTPSSTATTACASSRPRRTLRSERAAGLHAARLRALLPRARARASSGSTSATRCPKRCACSAPTLFYLGPRGAARASIRRDAASSSARSAGRYTSQVTVTLPASWNGAFRYASCFRASPGSGMGDPDAELPEVCSCEF